MAGDIVTDQSRPPTAHVVRETAISIAINGVISAGFFYALFGGHDPVGLWSVGDFVFDFLPLGFMVAMMGSLVPGLLARKAWRADRPAIAAPARILFWALQSAILAAAIGTALVAALVWLAGIDALPFATGLVVKIAYGMALALLVTPSILHGVWSVQVPPAKVRS